MQHYELNNEVGIFDFIEMHYLGSDIDDNDDEDDMQLPFKKITSQGHLSQGIPISKLVFVPQDFSGIVITPCNIYIDVLVDPALGSLFRPPRG